MIMRKNCCAVFSAKASTVKQPPNYGPEAKNMFKDILLLIISLISSIKGYGFQNKNPMANNKFWKSMQKLPQKNVTILCPFSKDPYLETEGSNYLMLLSVKDQEHTIHEKYYVSFLHKFLKHGVRSLTRVSQVSRSSVERPFTL